MLKMADDEGILEKYMYFLAPNTMQKPDCERVERVEMRPGVAAG